MSSLSRVALFQIIYLLIVVLWGAYVRASGSGAGCGSHWPLCNGVVVPRDPAWATIVELGHRLTSGLSLLLCLYVVYLAKSNRRALQASLATLLFLLLEAAIGAALVLFEHVGKNESFYRVISVSLHLVNTFLLLGAALYCYVVANPQVGKFRLPAANKLTWLIFGLFLLLITAVSGAVTALGDTLFPVLGVGEALSASMQLGANFLQKTRIYHPFLALASSCYLLVLAIFLQRLPSLKSWASGLFSVILVQILVGFLNIHLLAPIWLQIFHLLCAQILWLLLLRVCYLLSYESA